MKVGFMLNDEQLIQRIEQVKRNESDIFTFYPNLNSTQQVIDYDECDKLVISDRLYDFRTLCDVIERLRERHKGQVIVLLSNQHHQEKNQTIIKYCLSHELSYVHPGLSVEQVTAEVAKLIYAVNESESEPRHNVVVFVGTTPNIGTTLVAYTTAIELAKQTKQQVAYICLNLKSSKIHRYLGIDEPVVTMDDYRAEIKSQQLTEVRLRQYSIRTKQADNFHVLLGNMAREQAEFYSAEDIQHLLEIASRAFDLCIVDVNAYWDNAATICGLLCAGTRIVVSTGQLAHFQEDMNRWLKVISSAYNLSFDSFDIFLTQWSKSYYSGNYRLKDIRNETRMNIIGKLRQLNRVNALLNEGRINELADEEPQVIDELQGMITMLIKLHKLQTKLKPPKKIRLFSKTS